MPTKAERIQALKNRAAARRKKIDDLPAVKRLREAAELEEAAAIKLEAEHLKTQADRKRRDDAHAKIVIGAAVLLLSPARFLRVMIELFAVLTARDRNWIRNWCSEQGICLDQPNGSSEPEPADSKPTDVLDANTASPKSNEPIGIPGSDPSAQQQTLEPPDKMSRTDVPDNLSLGKPESPATCSCPDPVGEALKRAISGLNEGDITLFSPEILKNADGDDRKVLEKWFASLTPNRAFQAEEVKSAESDPQST